MKKDKTCKYVAKGQMCPYGPNGGCPYNHKKPKAAPAQLVIAQTRRLLGLRPRLSPRGGHGVAQRRRDLPRQVDLRTRLIGRPQLPPKSAKRIKCGSRSRVGSPASGKRRIPRVIDNIEPLPTQRSFRETSMNRLLKGLASLSHMLGPLPKLRPRLRT